MGRKVGNTNARKKAMVSDCMKQIAKKNIRHKDWCEYAVETYDITTRRADTAFCFGRKIITRRASLACQQRLGSKSKNS